MGDNNQGGYGQYNPFGGEQNNYAQQQPQQQQPQPQPQSYGYGGGYGQAGTMEQGNGGYGEIDFPDEKPRDALTPTNPEMQQPGGPTVILNKCKELNDAINELRAKREGQLASAQNSLLDSATGKEDQAARQTVDYIEDEINTALRYLRDQFKRIKETPGSGDSRVSGQVENVNRNLRREIEQYQRTQSDFRKRLEEQIRRRYEIANPEASPEELEQGVQNIMAGQEQAFMVCFFFFWFCLWGCARNGPLICCDRSPVPALARPTMPARRPCSDPPPSARSSRT